MCTSQAYSLKFSSLVKMQPIVWKIQLCSDIDNSAIDTSTTQIQVLISNECLNSTLFENGVHKTWKIRRTKSWWKHETSPQRLVSPMPFSDLLSINQSIPPPPQHYNFQWVVKQVVRGQGSRCWKPEGLQFYNLKILKKTSWDRPIAAILCKVFWNSFITQRLLLLVIACSIPSLLSHLLLYDCTKLITFQWPPVFPRSSFE